MRSAAIIAFSGLATAAIVPPSYEAPSYEAPSYDAPAPVYSSVEAASSAPAVTYPAEEPSATEYSTVYATITSCAPEVTNCPAESTVVESSVVPLTTSTIYSTAVSTIYECSEEVVDCPYESKTAVIVTETVAISTTVCPVSEAEPTPTNSYPVPEESGPAYPPVVPTKSVHVPEESAPVYPPPAHSTTEGNKPIGSTSAAPPKPTYPAPPAEEEELCPTVSVKTIVYTTQVPSVVTKYETIEASVPCPEPTAPGSVVVPPPHIPTGHNATTPAVPTGTAPVEAGAAGVSGSVLVAALAAVAAYAFA